MPCTLLFVFALLFGGAAAAEIINIQLGGVDCTVTNGELNCNGNCPTGRIDVPDSVTAVAPSAFKDCLPIDGQGRLYKYNVEITGTTNGICRMQLDWLNLPYDGVPRLAIEDCYPVNGGKCPTGHVVIPEGVRAVFGGIFQYCSEIKSITFPDSLVYLSGMVLHGYEDSNDNDITSIERLHIPSGLTFTNDRDGVMFKRLKNLKMVTYTGAHKPIVRDVYEQVISDVKSMGLTCDAPDCTEYFSECAPAKTDLEQLQDLQSC